MARHDYQPFGEEIDRPSYGADEVRKQFTGYERDEETELDFAQARYYRSGHGRFTSTDPILISDERLVDPQQINLYAYVRNNPYKYVDSTGERLMVVINGISYEYMKCNDNFKLIGRNGKEYKPHRDTYGVTVVKFLKQMLEERSGAIQNLMTRDEVNVLYVGQSESNTPIGDSPDQIEGSPYAVAGVADQVDASVVINGDNEESYGVFRQTVINASEALGRPIPNGGWIIDYEGESQRVIGLGIGDIEHCPTRSTVLTASDGGPPYRKPTHAAGQTSAAPQSPEPPKPDTAHKKERGDED